jgi:hypothetical protein
MAALSAVLTSTKSMYCLTRLHERLLSRIVSKTSCYLSVACSRQPHSSHATKVNLWEKYNRMKQSVEGWTAEQLNIRQKCTSGSPVKVIWISRIQNSHIQAVWHVSLLGKLLMAVLNINKMSVFFWAVYRLFIPTHSPSQYPLGTPWVFSHWAFPPLSWLFSYPVLNHESI